MKVVIFSFYSNCFREVWIQLLIILKDVVFGAVELYSAILTGVPIILSTEFISVKVHYITETLNSLYNSI